eukprot:COSAG03_NODE_24350_length_273_cov_0.568966_1_plen_52_part_10
MTETERERERERARERERGSYLAPELSEDVVNDLVHRLLIRHITGVPDNVSA